MKSRPGRQDLRLMVVRFVRLFQGRRECAIEDWCMGTSEIDVQLLEKMGVVIEFSDGIWHDIRIDG